MAGKMLKLRCRKNEGIGLDQTAFINSKMEAVGPSSMWALNCQTATYLITEDHNVNILWHEILELCIL
jgi:hypothetical protein